MKSAEKVKPELELDVKQLFDYLSYNPENGELRWCVDYGRCKSGDVAGNVNHRGYRSVWINGLQFFSHRVAWAMSYGKWPELDIDHINENKSDNRICNLRHASRSENMFNRGKNKNNTSGFKGVSFCLATGKWKAQITLDRKNVNIGRFGSKEEASLAYFDLAKKHRGEFAKC